MKREKTKPKNQMRLIQDYYNQNPLMVSSPFGGVNSFDVGLIKKIFNHLEIDVRGKKILDVGCGRGLISEYLQENGSSYYGIDIINNIDSEAAGFRFFLADGEELAFKNDTFDLLFCIDVFEHFSHQNSAVKEFKRVLTKNGGVFLSVPNYSNVAGIIKKYEEKSGGYKKNSWAPFGNWQPQELEQFITPGRIKRVFSEAGFSNFKVLGLDSELLLGLFPWIAQKGFPEAIKFRLQRWFPKIKAILTNLFPFLSLHNFWKIGNI